MRRVAKGLGNVAYMYNWKKDNCRPSLSLYICESVSERINILSIFYQQRRKYHVSQSLGYKNGYALADRPEVGIGGDPLTVNHLTEEEINELNNKRPTLTYGQAKQAPPEDFVPAHVAFDKKVSINCS